MIDRGWLHGIEIANGEGYSEEAFSFALANGLTMIGVSDVHDLIDWDYMPHLGCHRPVTLVLADSASPRDERGAVRWSHGGLLQRLVDGQERSATEAHAGTDRSEGRSLPEIG